jgi:hypothetical protein
MAGILFQGKEPASFIAALVARLTVKLQLAGSDLFSFTTGTSNDS